ncbi:hypothetical protein BBJ29_009929 [Phytophthora kernoviae]|uniref:Uncharacterized protein n=1 Tax=Phytophthora kernoviae TaxID=325452 RepID=A0A421G6R4_9STRA|nr:hypothetical protein BBJ29_009929 [Phytophthora kernoviae]
MESERTAQIEHFVNEKLAQTDGALVRFEEAEAKISSNLEAILARIRQVVEEKLVVLQDAIHPSEDTTRLIERIVEASSVSTAGDIKKTLEDELLRGRDEMQREIASGAEGPMREL